MFIMINIHGYGWDIGCGWVGHLNYKIFNQDHLYESVLYILAIISIKRIFKFGI